jgi:dTDP-4-dehydrorhamnose 3,5-epimerase
MIFTPVPIAGVFLVELEPITDERGSFARAFCKREFADAGIEFEVVQCNLARTTRPGVVRGLHYQRAPAGETKLVRCIAGAIFDVIVDVRPGSSTLHRSWWVELDAAERRALLVPPGVAHGYQSLVGDTEVFYMTDQFYAPELETGVRYDDPALAIPWPLPALDLTQRDRWWPLLSGGSDGSAGA